MWCHAGEEIFQCKMGRLFGSHIAFSNWRYLKNIYIKDLLKPIVDWITTLEGDYCSIHLIHSAFVKLQELLEEPMGTDILGQAEHATLKKKFNDRKKKILL